MAINFPPLADSIGISALPHSQELTSGLYSERNKLINALMPSFLIFYSYVQQGEWDSSVNIMTGYGLDGWGSIPGRGKRLFSMVSRPALWPTQNTGDFLFPQVKQPSHKSDHSLSSSAKVKNSGAMPPLPKCFNFVVFN
jgi:hypothetical protein